MQLVIYGRESTDILTSYAVSMFTAVVNSKASRPFFPEVLFPPGYDGKLVYYEPVADRHSLIIYWQVRCWEVWLPVDSILVQLLITCMSKGGPNYC